MSGYDLPVGISTADRAQSMLFTASQSRMEAQDWPEGSAERKQYEVTADYWERRAKELELADAPVNPTEVKP